jgi:hypothetical protein
MDISKLKKKIIIINNLNIINKEITISTKKVIRD